MSGQHQHPVLQAPLAHAALFALAVAPLLVHVPTNANIIATAALTVLVGCWRSVKPEPPPESMSKKVWHCANCFSLIGMIYKLHSAKMLACSLSCRCQTSCLARL